MAGSLFFLVMKNGDLRVILEFLSPKIVNCRNFSFE